MQDVDDNMPLFEEPVHLAHLRENSPPGALVTQMIANDADSPKFSEVEYEIVGASQDFTIEKSTGIVR